MADMILGLMALLGVLLALLGVWGAVLLILGDRD